MGRRVVGAERPSVGNVPLTPLRRRDGEAQELLHRPAVGGESRRHRGRSFPIALGALPPLAGQGLGILLAQSLMRVHEVIVALPPEEMPAERPGRLSRPPGTPYQQRYSLANGQVHARHEGRIQPATQPQRFQPRFEIPRLSSDN